MTAPLKTKRRLLYFASIGITASLTHIITVMILVNWSVAPLIANLMAFLVAFNISFLGHRHLTFAQLQNNKQLQLLPFFMVAIIAGILNEYLYYLLLRYTQLHYLAALSLVISIVAVFTFIASRLWACR